MNCTIPLNLLQSLLLFLSSQHPHRSLVIHSEASLAVAIANIMGEQERLQLKIQGAIGSSRSFGLFIHVFFPGQKLPDKMTKEDGSILVLITNECHPGSIQLPVIKGIILTTDLSFPNCCTLRQIVQTSRQEPPKFKNIAIFDFHYRKWLLMSWEIQRSLLSTSLHGVNVSVSILSATGISDEQVSRRFRNSISYIYWATLINHFKIGLDLKVIRYTPTTVGISSIGLTLGVFSQGGIDAVGDLVLISAERAEKFAFVLVGLEAKFHFIIRRPAYEFSWLALVRPLAPLTWLSILAMVIIVGVVLAILQHPKDFADAFFTSYGFCCNQAHLGTLKKVSIQTACVSALLCFFAVNQFYVSNLYSILSAREITYPFNTIEEFTERKTHKLLMFPDTSVYSAFQSAESGILRRVWESDLRDDPTHVLNGTNVVIGLRNLCNGVSTIFALPIQILPLSSEKCPLQAVPTGYFPNAMGITTRKDFPYLRHFRALFLRATEVGVSSYINKKYVRSTMPPLKTTSNLPEDPLPISLDQVILLFLIFGAALVSSVFFLLLEIIHFYVKKRKVFALSYA